MKYKKILLIGECFNNTTGGGITLSNLFKGWPKEYIALATTGDMLIDSDYDICGNVYVLGRKEYRLLFPFNIIQKKYISGKLLINKNILNDNMQNAKENRNTQVSMRQGIDLLKYTGLYSFIRKIDLSINFLQWLDDFNPDYIYTQLGSLYMISFVEKIMRVRRVPLIIHAMDDWVSYVSGGMKYNEYIFRYINKSFKKIIDKASVCISISDAMSIEYKKRYNKDFFVIHNPVDSAFWLKEQYKKESIDKQFTILYSGRVGVGIEKSLKDFVWVVETINQEYNFNIKIKIQTKDYLDWFNNYKCVCYSEYVDYDKLPKLYQSVSLLLISYDFEGIEKKFIKYSMPTKVTEYMISGTPILIYAPCDTALYQYAKKYKIAKIVGEKDNDKLKKAIVEIFENEPERNAMAINARTIALKNHDGNAVREFFRSCL